MTRRTALLAGATGLVGGHCLELLLQDDAWEQVAVLGRRERRRTSCPHQPSRRPSPRGTRPRNGCFIPSSSVATACPTAWSWHRSPARAPGGGCMAVARHEVADVPIPASPFARRTHTVLDPVADARILVYFTTNFLTATGASPTNTSTW